MDKVWTIIRKDLTQVYRRREMLLMLLLLPILFSAFPLGILIAMHTELSSEVIETDLPDEFSAFCPEELSTAECMQVYLVSQFMMMFMILPLSIPSALASYSIVGEKTTRSLEPLLATPITTLQLLLAKTLGSLLPAVLATYLSFGIYAAGVFLLVRAPLLVSALLDVRWLLAVFLLGPLLAVVSIGVSVIVSSRVNDPRVAEQISTIVVLPVVGVFIAQLAGLLQINRNFILAATAVVLLLDAILIFFAVRLFQRESILTRWK